MKKLLLLLILLCCTIGIYAQDIIVQKNGNNIKCNIKEYNEQVIKYSLISTTEISQIDINQVSMIIFSDGTRKVFKDEDLSVRNVDNIDISEDKVDQILNEKSNFLLLSAGYGDSYGSSIGVRGGFVFGEKIRIGLNGGLGVFKGHPQYALGCRVYFYREWGVNLALQTQGIIVNSVTDEFLYLQKGISLMLSYDQFFTKNFGITGSFGGFLDTNFKNELSLAGDAGVVFRF